MNATSNSSEGAGRRVGRFEVVSLLGRGGMGVVYRARDLEAGREVALKVIDVVQAVAEPQIVERFRREAQAAAALKHPNLVGVHDMGCETRSWWIALELVEGRNLAALVRDEGPRPPEEAARLTRDVARGLACAHAAGIVHRDVKPANVMLTPQGVPRLTDFGLARDLRASLEKLTRSGTVLGTPGYLAPEQANASEITPSADIHALGALLYALLAGRPPFRGETMVQTIKQVLLDEPQPPSSHVSGVPPALDTICLRCLEKAPERRYASAEALIEDLDRFLAGDSIESVSGDLARAVRRRWRPLWIAGIVALLAAAIAPLGFLHVRRTQLELLHGQAKAFSEPSSGFPDPAAVASLREQLAGEDLEQFRAGLLTVEALGLLAQGERARALERSALVGGGGGRLGRLLRAALVATDPAGASQPTLRSAQRELERASDLDPRVGGWLLRVRAGLLIAGIDRSERDRPELLREAKSLWEVAQTAGASDLEVRAGVAAGLVLATGDPKFLVATHALIRRAAGPLPSPWVRALIDRHLRYTQIDVLFDALEFGEPVAFDLQRGSRLRARLRSWGADASTWPEIGAEAFGQGRRLLMKVQRRTAGRSEQTPFLRQKIDEPLPPGLQGLQLLCLGALLDPASRQQLPEVWIETDLLKQLSKTCVQWAGGKNLGAGDDALMAEDLAKQVFRLVEFAPPESDLLNGVIGVLLTLRSPRVARGILVPLLTHVFEDAEGTSRQRKAALLLASSLMSAVKGVSEADGRSYAERALKVLETAGLLAPEQSSHGFTIAAHALRTCGRNQEAIRRAKQALERDGTDADAHLLLVVVLRQEKRWVQAARAVDAGVRSALQARMPRSLKHLGARAWSATDRVETRAIAKATFTLVAEDGQATADWFLRLACLHLEDGEPALAAQRAREAIERGGLNDDLTGVAVLLERADPASLPAIQNILRGPVPPQRRPGSR